MRLQSPYTNSNFKWIKDLNIRPDAMILIEQKINNGLELIGIVKDFLNVTAINKTGSKTKK